MTQAYRARRVPPAGTAALGIGQNGWTVPVYDYRCDHCGHAFSAVQSFKDEALSACPSCGQRPRRLVSTPAIVFKGSGWYKTDSRATPSAPKSGEPGGGEKAGAGGTGEKKKESTGETGAAKPANGGGRTGEAAS